MLAGIRTTKHVNGSSNVVADALSCIKTIDTPINPLIIIATEQIKDCEVQEINYREHIITNVKIPNTDLKLTCSFLK